MRNVHRTATAIIVVILFTAFTYRVGVALVNTEDCFITGFAHGFIAPVRLLAKGFFNVEPTWYNSEWYSTGLVAGVLTLCYYVIKASIRKA